MDKKQNLPFSSFSSLTIFTGMCLSLSPTGLALAADNTEKNGGETLVVEPNIHQLPKKLDGLCTLAALNDALATADVLVMLVDHSQFKAIQGDAVQQQYVVDTKGVWR